MEKHERCLQAQGENIMMRNTDENSKAADAARKASENSTLRVMAADENLQEVIDFVEEHLENMEASMKATMQVDISVEEIFVNIAHYAYAPEVGEAVIEVEEDTEKGEISITFRDRGIPYNPIAKEDPDLSLSAEEREIGGLGIFMVKKNMDYMKYEYSDGQNILTIVKKL